MHDYKTCILESVSEYTEQKLRDEKTDRQFRTCGWVILCHILDKYENI